jgi:hypothetical protein
LESIIKLSVKDLTNPVPVYKTFFHVKFVQSTVFIRYRSTCPRPSVNTGYYWHGTYIRCFGAKGSRLNSNV